MKTIHDFNMNATPITFFGTHQFACTILQGLIDDPLFEVTLVITQPDKPVGRKKEMTPSPVKLLAQDHDIQVETPISLKKYTLEDPSPLAVVAQYGKIIPQSILDAFPKGVINTHTSLLPKYRGASPIQSALVDGKKKTGVTIMVMDAGMDTGPLLSKQKVIIDKDITYPELDAQLALVGSVLLRETLTKYISGEITPQPQENDQATTCKLLSRDDGKIVWQDMTALDVYNRYRGLTPWPGIWTLLDGKRLKLLTVKPTKKTLQPGEIEYRNNTMYIGCKEGAVQVFQLQLEGKKAMDGESFANGFGQYSGIIVT